MNSVNLIGRLTKAPEEKTTNSGSTICNFSVAVNRIKDGTDFFNVTAFGKTAEFITKYFQKGSMIGITGRLNQNTWEKDGKKYSSVDIIAENVSFAGGTKSAPTLKEETGFDGDLPF